MNNINQGISCNVKECIYNEKGCNCNLDKVSISKGIGDEHYCKSFIPLHEERDYDFPLENEERFQSNNHHIESGEEYLNFSQLIEDIEEQN